VNIRVAPDGSVFDHVGEFMFEAKDRLYILFGNDYEAYKESVANTVQLLVLSGTLVGGNRSLIEGTSKLKQQLAEVGRLSYSDFFSDSDRSSIKASASSWLSDNWQAIINELRDPNSSALTGAIGHLRREFYYAWIRKDENWGRTRYAFEGTTVHVPEGLLRTFAKELEPLTTGRGISPQVLFEWMDENLVSHYRILVSTSCSSVRTTTTSTYPRSLGRPSGFSRCQPNETSLSN
jgi:hypothetical protein